MNPALSSLLSRVASYYQSTLDNSPNARARLVALGIKDASLLDRFSVGHVDGTITNIIPKKGDVKDQLAQLGILDAQGHERFKASFSVPITDDQGRVVQMAFYSADGKLVSWLLDEMPTFWNAACLKHSPTVTLVADPLKGLALVGQGTVGVIAPGGPVGKRLGQGARDALALHKPHITISADVPDILAKHLRELGAAVDGPGQEQPTSSEKIIDQDANGFTLEFPHRVRFVVQGIIQDSPRHLRAAVKVFVHRKQGEASPSRLHLDTLDLYHAKSRMNFARTAAIILQLDPTTLEEFTSQVVLTCERFLREREQGKTPTAVVLTAQERAEAMKFLTDPKLLDRVLVDLAALGFVGEETNALVAYVASISRKLADPISILTVSRSGAGKSTLAEAVASLVPSEDLLKLTRLTPQTLFYQRPDALHHRLVVVEEETGLQEAAYAARVLMSSGALRLSSASGYGTATTREVRGPASMFVTTTRTDVDEETAGRFLVLTADESPEQTRRIIEAQRAAAKRPVADQTRILALQQNAQRLLRPLGVVIAFADRLTFPHDRLSARRDHKKYLGLIRAVTLLHQFQREVEGDSVFTEIEDIRMANRLAVHVLGQSLSDLSAPSKRLLVELRDWLSKRATTEGKTGIDEVRFTRRQLRDHTGWKRTQLEEHLKELVRAEYVIVQTGGSQGRITEYRLDWDGVQGIDGEKFLRGLADPDQLKHIEPQLAGLVGTCRTAPDKSKPRHKADQPSKTQESDPLVGLSEGEA
jgi:energy-coupling factor transporter ATP-binding protein EcfA2